MSAAKAGGDGVVVRTQVGGDGADEVGDGADRGRGAEWPPKESDQET
jgi:hypothetical protein